MRLGGRTRKLEGDRVELRRHERQNFPLYEKWYADPEIWRLTSWRSSPMKPSETRKLFEDRELSGADDSFAIHVKGERDPIGVIGLMNISDANTSADLSIIVGHPDDRQRGYGAEAIEVMLRHGFHELGLNRVGLSVFAFNEDAMSTYEKLGFEEEGRLRRAIKRDGSFHDAILMSVLKSEWESG
ncbi:MAG: GNAT family N-acetyltransferase [Rubrobacter sp.]|nr:GNAT family N-acetyltransferase [Rubrobacter sp.]